MQAVVGQPTLHVIMHVLCIGLRRHSGEIAGTIFADSLCRFWGQVLWHLWIGRARHLWVRLLSGGY